MNAITHIRNISMLLIVRAIGAKQCHNWAKDDKSIRLGTDILQSVLNIFRGGARENHPFLSNGYLEHYLP